MDRLVIDLAVLVLAGFVGFSVISKVPNTLHTPLMSGTNAIHGIVVLGGLLLMSQASGALEKVLLVIAVAFGTINVVGGFLVTDRMLGMFKTRPARPGREGGGTPSGAAGPSGGGTPSGAGGPSGGGTPSHGGALEGEGPRAGEGERR
ncbi:MAG TPA: NAD(P) transhydrogenase subunit alpha [Solirubrobacteraceae bacterium]|nr:NAD(P) transhydrogenase subunit alpha [Solirubrobacteraceae bacterium]